MKLYFVYFYWLKKIRIAPIATAKFMHFLRLFGVKIPKISIKPQIFFNRRRSTGADTVIYL